MQREIQIMSCLQYAFELTYFKHNEIIKGFGFPFAYLPNANMFQLVLCESVPRFTEVQDIAP